MRRIGNLAFSGIQFKMRQKIMNKLEKAGATTEYKAVTIEEAELDSQEQNWLNYFAGGFFSKIKKTEDKRYYL
jgi:hypothetical protein